MQNPETKLPKTNFTFECFSNCPRTFFYFASTVTSDKFNVFASDDFSVSNYGFWIGQTCTFFSSRKTWNNLKTDITAVNSKHFWLLKLFGRQQWRCFYKFSELYQATAVLSMKDRTVVFSKSPTSFCTFTLTHSPHITQLHFHFIQMLYCYFRDWNFDCFVSNHLFLLMSVYYFDSQNLFSAALSKAADLLRWKSKLPEAFLLDTQNKCCIVKTVLIYTTNKFWVMCCSMQICRLESTPHSTRLARRKFLPTSETQLLLTVLLHWNQKIVLYVLNLSILSLLKW